MIDCMIEGPGFAQTDTVFQLLLPHHKKGIPSDWFEGHILWQRWVCSKEDEISLCISSQRKRSFSVNGQTLDQEM